MLNTRCSVLAAANPRFGTHDDLTNTAEQIDFETTILSRFDMLFLVKDVRDPDRDYISPNTWPACIVARPRRSARAPSRCWNSASTSPTARRDVHRASRLMQARS